MSFCAPGYIGSDRVMVGQHDLEAEFRPGLREGRLVVPLGPLLDILGIDAEWRSEGSTFNLWRVKPNPLSISTKRYKHEFG